MPRSNLFVLVAVLASALSLPGDGGSAFGQPYDFSEAEALLNAELPNLDENVAVIVRQGGVDLFRFQHGAIGYDTQNRLASFTKTISAGVILALVDDGVIDLDERLGDALPFFETNGLGDPTVLDCWAMRHGITTPSAYHRDPSYTLLQSVALIGSTGSVLFPAGTELGYDGLGMQTVGLIAAQRDAQPWETVARNRILDRCDMPDADFQQFTPNPAVAGGLRSSAEETIRYAQMIIDRGIFGDERVLSEAAIERLFTNNTRGLPVQASPWSPTHPLYPYGVEPDYGFGAWVFAEHPVTQHEEELIGAGAWGSFLWIDRRRGLTAVLITDIVPQTQASMDAALGLFDITRRTVEDAQVTDVVATPENGAVRLAWQPPAGAIGARVYAATETMRDIFDLADAVFTTETSASEALVPPYAAYAVTAVFPELENTAIVPAANSLGYTPCRADVDASGTVDFGDVLSLIAAWGPVESCPPFIAQDLDEDCAVEFDDLLTVLGAWGSVCDG